MSEPLFEAGEAVAKQAVMFTAEQLADFVRAELQKEREAHQKEMSAVQSQLTVLTASLAGTVPTLIREHGGGLGNEVHDTWSQFEQELAFHRDERARLG